MVFEVNLADFGNIDTDALLEAYPGYKERINAYKAMPKSGPGKVDRSMHEYALACEGYRVELASEQIAAILLSIPDGKAQEQGLDWLQKHILAKAKACAEEAAQKEIDAITSENQQMEQLLAQHRKTKVAQVPEQSEKPNEQEESSLAVVRNSNDLIPKGKADATYIDYVNALEWLGFTFAVSELDDRVYLNGLPMSDALEAKILNRMAELGFRDRHTQAIQRAWLERAHELSFHPIREWLLSRKWDGNDHISELCSHFTDEDGMFPIYLRKWLIGATAKVLLPGKEQNAVLTFSGNGGMGKSYFAQWLCSGLPDYFTEQNINPDSKDDLGLLATKFVWEIGELGSTTRKADRESLKRFLTQSTVTFRTPYDKYAHTKPSLASFIGTVNDEGGFLNDPTGTRRFWVIALTEIDKSYSRNISVEQLWAQAVSLFKNGETWKLTEVEEAKRTEINEKYAVEDPFSGLLLTRFEIDKNKHGDPEWRLTTNNIIEELTRGYTPDEGRRYSLPNTMVTPKALAPILKNLGGKRIQIGEKRLAGWAGIRLIPSIQEEPFGYIDN